MIRPPSLDPDGRGTDIQALKITCRWGTVGKWLSQDSGPDTSSPPLLRRFALYAGVALVIAALAAFFLVRQYATSRAERTAVSHSDFIAESVLPLRLHPSDFAGPVHGARLRELDRFIRNELLVDGALRVKLYARGGNVVYSDDHPLIGTHPSDGDVSEALLGHSSGSTTNLNSEGGSGPNQKALETYVPVRLQGRVV
jgi:hypothetical protein